MNVTVDSTAAPGRRLNGQHGRPGPQMVWLVVDGTVALEPGVAQTASQLVWTGHTVTVVIALPKPGWSLNALLVDHQYRRQQAWLRRRHNELAAGLRAGPGKPCPGFTGGGRIRVRWTTGRRPGLGQWVRARLRRDDPSAGEALQDVTGCRWPRCPPPGRCRGDGAVWPCSRRPRPSSIPPTLHHPGGGHDRATHHTDPQHKQHQHPVARRVGRSRGPGGRSVRAAARGHRGRTGRRPSLSLHLGAAVDHAGGGDDPP